MKIEKYIDSSCGFPYIAYISEELSEHPALILQLHGAGERGNGENLDIVLVNGFPNGLTDENFKDCIIVFPQCPADSFWVAKIESVKKFLDNAVEKYNADKSRLYLCGMSMGGYGTWYTAEAYPDVFAAIAPCCGGGMVWHAGVLKMPIWAFHGLDDTCVMPSETTNMVEQVKACGGDVTCTLYEGVGHGSWVKAFSPELLKWLLSKKKQ